LEDGNCTSLLPATEKQDYRARRFFVGAMAACALLWPALYNGYPTLFSDTGGYLLTGKFFLALPPFRAPGYALFTKLTSVGVSGWFTVILQAAMVVYVLYETCEYLVEGDRRIADLYFLGSVGILTALTSLPWLVSLLMPDVFAGVLFLSAFLVVFGEEMRPPRRVTLATIFAISVAAHASLLPIGGFFAVTLFLLRQLSAPPRALHSTKSALAWLLVPILAAGIGTAALNRQMGLGFRISPSRNSFLLARLFGDGLAADFLHANCPKQNFISCRYLSQLPQTQEEFLFQHPLYPDLKDHELEMETIVRGTIRAYPMRFVASSVKETFLQLTSLRTGDEIRTYGAREWNSNVLPLVFPADFQEFLESRQYRDRLTPAANASATLDNSVFWLSVATSFLLAWTGRFGRINLFFYAAAAYLVINAGICASFAGVYDRYQGRVAWIMPFCLTAYVCCLAREWKRSEVLGELPEMEELEAPVE
jgi:hypothetical protein